MLIINADDYGRSRRETDAALECFSKGRITSATAMVYMVDTDRAADLARRCSIDLGLHLNLTEPFTGTVKNDRLRDYHGRITRFMTSSKYAACLYNPILRRQFRYVFESQLEEFVRVYDRFPSHIDGHHHAHLCTNILVGKLLPSQHRVRRSFSFLAGEKNLVNLWYRRCVDWSLKKRYKITDFFFSLQQSMRWRRLNRVFELAGTSTVELMTHPINPDESAYLLSDDCGSALNGLFLSTYQAL